MRTSWCAYHKQGFKLILMLCGQPGQFLWILISQGQTKIALNYQFNNWKKKPLYTLQLQKHTAHCTVHKSLVLWQQWDQNGLQGWGHTVSKWGTHQIVMSTCMPVVGCLIKKGLQKGGGAGCRQPRTPLTCSYALSLRSHTRETIKILWGWMPIRCCVV